MHLTQPGTHSPGLLGGGLESHGPVVLGECWSKFKYSSINTVHSLGFHHPQASILLVEKLDRRCYSLPKVPQHLHSRHNAIFRSLLYIISFPIYRSSIKLEPTSSDKAAEVTTSSSSLVVGSKSRNAYQVSSNKYTTQLAIYHAFKTRFTSFHATYVCWVVANVYLISSLKIDEPDFWKWKMTWLLEKACRYDESYRPDGREKKDKFVQSVGLFYYFYWPMRYRRTREKLSI